MLLQLPWLPVGFAKRVLIAATVPGLEYNGYMARVQELHSLFMELLDHLIFVGDYSITPVDQAFIRYNDEPGRAWNMDEWRAHRRVRQTLLTA